MSYQSLTTQPFTPGNANNFVSEAACIENCLRSEAVGVGGSLVSAPSDGQFIHTNFQLQQNLNLPEECREKRVGRVLCSEEQVQYYFDGNLRKCRPLIVCPENANFLTKEACSKRCETSPTNK
jgi:hypothetical protein